MINFSTAYAKNFRLPHRVDSTALDQERSFLARLVTQPMKKNASFAVEACRLPTKNGLTRT